MGPFQGIRSVRVEDSGGEPCVVLYTGGSAFHFRISVYPSRTGHSPPPWWLGEVSELECAPGIFLATEGK